VHNRITVAAKNTKTKIGHTVLLNSDAKKAIESLLEWLKAKGITDKSAPLFLSQKRTISGALKAISRIQAHRIIKDLFAQIGLLGSSYSSHCWRKTMAKYIYDMTGGKIEKVAAVLCHASLNSTLSYLSFNNSDIDDALTAMEF
jgi:site-specific recombinase XerD